MSKIKVTGMPAEYRDGSVILKFHMDARDRNYLAFSEASKLPEVIAAVEQARQALAGTESMIFVRVIEGRKPNGFDKFMAENRAMLEVRRVAA